MRVLQIANGYCGSKLYQELFLLLSENVVFQFIFAPFRKNDEEKKFNIENKKVFVFYVKIVKSIIYRLIFYLKIRKSIEAVEKNTSVVGYQLCHAHSLFSDGAIAYYFKKKYKIPYIVAVRNTDINDFLKYLKYLKPLGKKIILNSSHVVFLSVSYKKRLQKSYKNLSNIIEDKAIILPNGINDFWHKNINFDDKQIIDNKVNIIYAGEIRKNKNIINSIKAIELLQVKYKIQFSIIGEGLNDEIEYLIKLKHYVKDKEFVKIYKSMPKEELIKFYRNSHIFLMPSFTETFGLVYAEALTQRLPVVYTKNEGFDNIFENGFVGYSVIAFEIHDISSKIEQIIFNYNQIQKNTITVVNQFDWSVISQKYFQIYKTLVK